MSSFMRSLPRSVSGFWVDLGRNRAIKLSDLLTDSET